MAIRIILVAITMYFCVPVSAKSDSIPHRPDRLRLWLTAGANAALWTGSFIALDKAWYADYPRSGFHFFDDGPEWNQADKLGHVWSTYQVSRASTEMWKWTGLSDRTAVVLGGSSGMLYQSVIELQDAYSVDWGFSWGDMAANLAGAGLFVFQELHWKEQRIQVKLSYWPRDYPQRLEGRADELFGASAIERILKDYNGQTYWLSANVSDFLPRTRVPRWLNMALGYGATGMYGGRTNVWTDGEGAVHDYSNVPRRRVFYLSPDIDFTKIKTNSRFMRSLFFVLNAVKVPAPALQLDNQGKFRVRPLKF